MPPAQSATRHQRLFDVLHQQSCGSAVSRRLEIERLAEVDGQAQALHLELALRSWDRPQSDRSQPDRREVGSAPEPLRDYKFFRAVRA